MWAKHLGREDSSATSSQDSRSEGRLQPPEATLSKSIIGANKKPRYKLVAMKLVTPSKEHLEKHYEDLSDKPFYKGLVTCTFELRCFRIGTNGGELIGSRHA